MGVLAAALAGLIVVNLLVFVLLLASSRRRVRGGQLDLTAATARGELDLDWGDQRPTSKVDERLARRVARQQDEAFTQIAEGYGFAVSQGRDGITAIRPNR